jgi:DNA polymerase III subunit epsilon
MLPKNISFIDIETTGCRTSFDRIIEIGILRIEDDRLVKTFHSLLNPQVHIPREIELLTGIQSKDLENAPTFRQIKDDILEILEDSYFVAHNVRFDYGFLKQEFRRENISFSQKHFCTVRLSRLLYPSFKHHNLDSIIERFGFDCENRHRAFDDAKILFDFYKKARAEFENEIFENAISKCLKKPSTPLKLQLSILENLPECPGVYIFYSDTGMPLYVGKSINIRDRVLSHFSSDIRSGTEMNISQQVANIETLPTAGELGALLLESKLIKKLLPLYNKRSRIKQELVAIKCKLNKDGYKEVFLEPVSTILPEQIDANPEREEMFMGFFRSRRQAKEYLTKILKEYSLCDKLLGLEKTKNSCFSYRLDHCKGACIKDENPLSYNLRFTEGFAECTIKPWPFKGPISIKEIDQSGKCEYFLMDKWCFVGNVIVNEFEDKKTQLFDDMTFDLDTYKILKQFISKPQNIRKIQVLNSLAI